MKRASFLILVASLTLAPVMASAYVTELCLNGNLEAWTGGVPDSWDMTNRSAAGAVNASPIYTVTQETTDIRPGTAGTSAMRMSATATTDPFRYWAFTNQIEPVATGNLPAFNGWLKGTYCRAYPAYTEDSGATWITINTAPIGAHSGSADWKNVTGSLTGWDDTARKFKLAFHSVYAGEHLVDDISLIGDNGLPPPLSATISPLTSIYQTRTITLVATPQGGTGTYTSVAFDIGNDGSVEATDTTAPYEYVWDTQATEAGKGTVEVKVTVTDSAPATGDSVFTYTVDNRNDGRVELMTNADFDNFQGTSPNNLPVDWFELQVDANKSYGPADDNPDALSTPSLSVTFADFDNVTKYTLRWKGVQNIGGVYEDHQVAYWGKGGSSGLQYWKSLDGSTWENTDTIAAAAAAPVWVYAVGQVKAQVAENLGGFSTISTSSQAATCYFDKISYKAILIPPPPPPAAATGWSVYE